MIGRGGEKGSGISVLMAQQDDDDDDLWLVNALLDVFKTVLRGLWTFSFVWHKFFFLGSVCRVGWSANTLSYQAVFSHVSPHGDLSCFCLSPCPSHVLKSLPPPSTLSLSRSGYTAVLRITYNFLIKEILN